VGEIIIGFALFFVGFAMLRSTASTLISPDSFGFLKGWTGMGFLSVLLFLIIGTLLTICFQSSAATMAIIMLLITSGVIPFKMAAAMILGENIGTTIAANVAASIGNTTSKRAAMAHTVFNVFGVCWVLAVFPFFLKLIGMAVSSLFGLPDPNSVDFSAYADGMPSNVSSSLLYSVTTMHTIFNLTNTLILVWFIPQIEKIVCGLIQPKKSDTEDEFRLQYIRAGIMKTPEISVLQAQKEIVVFGEKMEKMFALLKELYATTDEKSFQKLFERIEKYEDMSDLLGTSVGALKASYHHAVRKISDFFHTRD
jgi:phosphate:Na+ symporter